MLLLSVLTYYAVLAISHTYMLCMAILATAIKYLSMAILTVYSLPYELQACAGAQVLYLLLYGCTCTSMMLLFYRMHNGCEYSFHGYTHELREGADAQVI